MAHTPDFQEILKRMLSSSPKDNKPLNADKKKNPQYKLYQ